MNEILERNILPRNVTRVTRMRFNPEREPARKNPSALPFETLKAFIVTYRGENITMEVFKEKFEKLSEKPE